ncbi:MAG TPA: hypothetical protein VJN39_02265 [Gemmatimonadales bacterium]|nr:hypothetical protein [Gemmatimonadales bacterium]
MQRTVPIAALAAVLVTPIVLSAPTQAAASYTYQGTIHAVDARTGSLDLITGVGMALRLVHMTISPTTLLPSASGSLRVAALRPGDVVRAECRITPTGLVASRIEKIEVPPQP